MADQELHDQINRLVDAEHALRSQPIHTADQRAELARIEESLDQCWDLLRQRQALREAGRDPSSAHARPVTEVEGYIQ
jgi:hypothetical protein